MLCRISILILLVFNTGESNGSCWFSPLKNKTTEYGSVRHYCEYSIHRDGEKASIPFETMPGSKFETLDCMECSCTMDGLSCCGKGFYAGTFQGPDMCTVVPDGCQPIFVLKTNNKTDCFTRRPVQPNQFLKMNGRSSGQTVKRIVLDIPNISQGGVSNSFSRQMSVDNMPGDSLQQIISNMQPENIVRHMPSNTPSESFVSQRHFVSSANIPTEKFMTVPSENFVSRRQFIPSVPNDNIVTTRQFVSNVPSDNVVTNRRFVTSSGSSNIPAEAEKAIRDYIRSQMNLQNEEMRGNTVSRNFMARPNIGDMESFQRQFMANMESVAPRAMPAEATIRHVHTERRFTGEPIVASRATSMWPSTSASKQAQMITTGGSSGRASTQSETTNGNSGKSDKNSVLDKYLMMKLLGAL